MVVRIDVDARLSMLAIRLIRALCHALMKELPLLTLRLTHLPSDCMDFCQDSFFVSFCCRHGR